MRVILLDPDNNDFETEEIEFSVDDLTFSGTLTLPLKEKNPCVLLLSGYGSTDRSNVSGNFKRHDMIAKQLADSNIASLRYDDRGSGKSSKVNWHDYTFDDTGSILKSNIITPTAQNAANIEKDAKVIAENLLGKPDDELKQALEIMARAYDPCISCSVHLVHLS